MPGLRPSLLLIVGILAATFPPAGAEATVPVPHPKPAARAPTPPALAVRARPGKNSPAALGGAAKYDAKKGAVLGATIMPHKR